MLYSPLAFLIAAAPVPHDQRISVNDKKLVFELNFGYGRLFQVAPELRPLFHGNIAVQGRKFVDMLGALVSELPDLGKSTGVAGDGTPPCRLWGCTGELCCRWGGALVGPESSLGFGVHDGSEGRLGGVDCGSRGYDAGGGASGLARHLR